MRIKKFVANSMPEAMKQIKEQLGNDAIILNSKEIKPSGIFGLFKRKKIEVTAMLDEDIRTPTKPRVKSEPKQQPKINYAASQKGNVNEDRILDEIKHLQSILTKQPIQNDVNFPPMLNSVYEYLIDQEVEAEIASQIVQSLSNESNKDELDRETIERLLRLKIEGQLSETSFAN